MKNSYLITLGKISNFISQFFRWILIIIAMTAIGVGSAGFATLWGLIIVKFLKKTITFNTSIHNNYLSYISAIEDRTNSIIEKHKEFIKAYKTKLVYNVILFIIFFLGFIRSFTIEDNTDELFFKIFFGFFSLIIIFQFLYFRIAKKEIEKYNNLKAFKNIVTNTSNQIKNDENIFAQVNEGETTKQKREELNKNLIEFQQKEIPLEIDDFEDFPSRFNENCSKQVSTIAIESGRQVLEDLRKELKTEPTFEDFINDFIESHGKQVIEQKFDGLTRVAKNIGLNIDAANDYYDRTFRSASNSLDLGSLVNEQNEDENEQYEDDDMITLEQWEKQNELFREVLAYKSFESAKPDYENRYEKTLIERFQKIIFDNFTPNQEQEINQLSKDIFEYCLIKSDKDVTFEEISNVNITDILNNSNKIYYTPIYGSLKKTMHSIPENIKKNSVQNTYHSANYLFNELTNLIIPQINNI